MVIKLNKEICEDYLETLRVANEQWFSGYHYSRDDYNKLMDAMIFFENIKVEQRKKLIKEGQL